MAEFKRKKLLTRPVLKLQEGVAVHVLIEGPMHLGKKMEVKPGEKEKEPATLIDVVNLDTGEQAQIIATAVIKSVLNESYPNDSYVGLGFAFTKGTRQAGKQYNPVHIEEIELPASDAAPSGKGKK